MQSLVYARQDEGRLVLEDLLAEALAVLAEHGVALCVGKIGRRWQEDGFDGFREPARVDVLTRQRGGEVQAD